MQNLLAGVIPVNIHNLQPKLQVCSSGQAGHLRTIRLDAVGGGEVGVGSFILALEAAAGTKGITRGLLNLLSKPYPVAASAQKERLLTA